MSRKLGRSAALLSLGIALLSTSPGMAEVSDVSPAAKDRAAARDIHIDDLAPVLNERPRPQEKLRGMVTAVDQRDDLITVRLASGATADLRVRDGLMFNAIRYGDPVEVTVETIDGAKTIVDLTKL
jgi:hypothetical protein